MEEVDDLHQGLLGLVLPRHIREGDAGLLFHIDLGLGLTDAADAADAAATHFFGHGAHHQAEQQIHNGKGQHPAHQERDNGRHRLHDLIIIRDIRLGQPGQQVIELDVGNQPGVEPVLLIFRQLRLICRQNIDAVRLEYDLGNLAAVHHGQKLIVGNLLIFRGLQPGDNAVEQQRKNHRRDDQRQVALERGFVVVAAGLVVILLGRAVVILIHFLSSGRWKRQSLFLMFP